VAGETVTRIRKVPAGDDRYGNPTFTTAESPIDGAFFDPGSSSEVVVVGGEPMVTKPTVYFPHAWPDLVEADDLRVRGVTYTVQGRPDDWRSPWGSSIGGLVVHLQLAEGGGA